MSEKNFNEAKEPEIGTCDQTEEEASENDLFFKLRREVWLHSVMEQLSVQLDLVKQFLMSVYTAHLLMPICNVEDVFDIEIPSNFRRIFVAIIQREYLSKPAHEILPMTEKEKKHFPKFQTDIKWLEAKEVTVTPINIDEFDLDKQGFPKFYKYHNKSAIRLKHKLL